MDQSAVEDTHALSFALLPSSLNHPQPHDDVLDNLIASLHATVTYPDESVRALAENTLVEVRRIQKAVRRRLIAQQREITLKRLGLIVDLVEVHFRLEAGTLRGSRKPQRIALARQICYWLCRSITGLSFPLIGESLGKDHSTVMFGFNLIEQRVAHDGGFRQFIKKLETQIAAASPTPKAKREPGTLGSLAAAAA
jgi:chromosomal replication initiation ATPase DnaA